MAVLKKQLGLLDVFAVTSGAMISSGLFVLPAIAYAKAGPAINCFGPASDGPRLGLASLRSKTSSLWICYLGNSDFFVAPRPQLSIHFSSYTAQAV